MAQCPLHGGAAHHADGPVTHHTHQPGDTAPLPVSDCQLSCSDEDLSPAVVLGHAGVLPTTAILPSPGLVIARLTPPTLVPPEPPVPVSVPPPRG